MRRSVPEHGYTCPLAQYPIARSARTYHSTVMTPSSPMRCQGRPTTSAWSCSRVSVCFTARPCSGQTKAALVQAPRGKPHSDAVAYQHFHAIAAPVGKHIHVIRARCPKHLNYASQRRGTAGTHIHRVDGQPYGIVSNHRNQSRSSVAHALAPCKGERIDATAPPRRSSISMTAQQHRRHQMTPAISAPARNLAV
ncbi:hypothetical protein M2361_005062 [Achromobacter sp. JUb104]|nr:hypothetical protein [Achromobacter sp. JUb104]